MAYNRFRYYDNESGSYISQDPSGLHGGIQLYGYVHDTNSWIDPFGLAKRGPKTGGKGPHNQTIKSWADEVISDGGTIIYGGGAGNFKDFGNQVFLLCKYAGRNENQQGGENIFVIHLLVD